MRTVLLFVAALWQPCVASEESTGAYFTADGKHTHPEGRTIGQTSVPFEELQCIVFNADGTVIDTADWFYPPWTEAGARYEIKMTKVEYFRWLGLSLREMAKRAVISSTGIDPDIPGPDGKTPFLDGYLQAYIFKQQSHTMFAKQPKAIEPVVDIARRAFETGIPIALVATNSREQLDRMLKFLKLDGLFNAEFKSNVISLEASGGAARHKPSPDVYFEAARRLGADPTKCRSYDNSEAGLIAAYRAGMQVIDATYIEGYPLMPELLEAKALDEADRDWTVEFNENWFTWLEGHINVPGTTTEVTYLAPMERAKVPTALPSVTRWTPVGRPIRPWPDPGAVVYSISGWMAPDGEMNNEQMIQLIEQNHAQNRKLFMDLKMLSNPPPLAVWHSFRFNAHNELRQDGFSIKFDTENFLRWGDATKQMLELAERYSQRFITQIKIESPPSRKHTDLVRWTLLVANMHLAHEEQQATSEKEYMRVLMRPPSSELSAVSWSGSDGGGADWKTWYNQFTAAILEWWRNTAEPGKQAAWACIGQLGDAISETLDGSLAPALSGDGDTRLPRVALAGVPECELLPRRAHGRDAFLFDLPRVLPERLQIPLPLPQLVPSWLRNWPEQNKLEALLLRANVETAAAKAPSTTAITPLFAGVAMGVGVGTTMVALLYLCCAKPCRCALTPLSRCVLPSSLK